MHQTKQPKESPHPQGYKAINFSYEVPPRTITP